MRFRWVLRLRASVDVDVGGAASPPALIADALARVGQGPVSWALEVSDSVVGLMAGEVPALAGSPGALELLRRGNEATTLQALSSLLDPDAAALVARDATLEGIRSFVHRSVPLEAVLRGVRVGHAATADALSGACVEILGAQVAAAELTALSRDLFAYVDRLADAMIRTYLAEYEVWSTSAAAARAEVVRSLVGGEAPTDPDVASRALGYELRRRHLAVVAWADSARDGAALQTAATESLRAVGAVAVLTVPVASDRVWAWGAVPTAESGRGAERAKVEAILARHRVRAAFGDEHDGVRGFRCSHHQAVRGAELERLRRRAGRPARSLTRYGEVAAVALLSGDLDAARVFVREHLGGLAGPGEAMATLRTTLFHYLDAERSLLEVGRRLHVAKGTVTYRVRRAQEVLGHGLDHRRFELHAALRLAEELGDSVLRETR